MLSWLQVKVEGYDDIGSYKKVMAIMDASKLLMSQEMEFLDRNHNRSIVKEPMNKRVVGCKRVFKKKEGSSSDVYPSIKLEY